MVVPCPLAVGHHAPHAVGSGLRLEGFRSGTPRLGVSRSRPGATIHPRRGCPGAFIAAAAAGGAVLAGGCRHGRRRAPTRTSARVVPAPVVALMVPSVTLPDPSRLPIPKRNLIYDDGPRKELTAALGLRDVPCLLFLVWGIHFAVMNILGALGLIAAGGDYDTVLSTGVWLASFSGVGGLVQAMADGTLADERPGMAKEPTIVAFYSLWNLAVVWLCARLGAGYGGLPGDIATGHFLDPVMSFVCSTAFFYGAAGPTATLAEHGEASSNVLTDVEAARLKGLTEGALPGALYLVDAAAFANGGGQWWARVNEMWPAQRPCEQTTLLCGALACEVCMLLHRLGREGVLRFRGEAIPAGIGACVLLTVLPTLAQLYWHRNDISLWEFYFV
uniref:Uncharacterized protein n=1 Tax=Alexandrium monilatum TaxID=311494 RepID=A0A7S4PVP2_9DINO